MKISNIALVAALLAGSSIFADVAADAQGVRDAQRRKQELNRRGQRGEQQPQQAQVPQLSPAENAAIGPLVTAYRAQDWTTATAALPAAQAAAQSAYAKYLVGEMQFGIGRATQNQQLQTDGVEAMLASGAVPPENVQPLLVNRASFAIRAENWPRAEEALTRILETDPNNVERVWQLAEVKIKLNKNPEALALYQRLIQLGEASGQRASEERYRRAYALAQDTRNAQAAAQIQAALLQHYPSSDSLRLALVELRQAASQDPAMALDIRRLMRAAGTFTQGNEYVEFADRLNRAGLPAEAQAVLQEGTSSGRIPATDTEARQMLAAATRRAAEDQRSLSAARARALAAANGREARVAGDLYYGAGQYREAAELYRAALQKGGEDSNLVNTRLGAALALANQRAEAEAALRAVTGARAPLANFWLMWLGRRGG